MLGLVMQASCVEIYMFPFIYQSIPGVSMPPHTHPHKQLWSICLPCQSRGYHESRGPWISLKIIKSGPFLFPTYLERLRDLCSQGTISRDGVPANFLRPRDRAFANPRSPRHFWLVQQHPYPNITNHGGFYRKHKQIQRLPHSVKGGKILGFLTHVFSILCLHFLIAY